MLEEKVNKSRQEFAMEHEWTGDRLNDIWRYQRKMVRLVDRHGRTLTVTPGLYRRLLKVKGFVKVYVGIVYEWTAKALKVAYLRLGKGLFMKLAGAMKLGEKAFRLAVMLAEGDVG
ncbi:MAG: hypothetical protein JRH07_08925 [Deltaproteobacteria bacterium]|nr:hypothetical protein [Deltaproteobacteria bacterium]